MSKPRDLANVVAAGNVLADGAVAPAELTGVTSTAAEINILDGVTSTATELTYWMVSLLLLQSLTM